MSCREVGEVAEIGDGPGDVRPNLLAPPPPPAPSGLDLERVALSRSDTDICAEWEVEAPARQMTSFIVLLREAGAGDSGALIKVSAQVLAEGETSVQLQYPRADERPDRGFVDGVVSVSGHRVSMRVRRSDLPTYLSLDRFEWEAQTLASSEDRRVQYVDCVPEAGDNVAYPGGAIVVADGAAC